MRGAVEKQGDDFQEREKEVSTVQKLALEKKVDIYIRFSYALLYNKPPEHVQP